MTSHQKMLADLAPGEELRWSEEPSSLALITGQKGIISVILTAIVLTLFGSMAFSMEGIMSWIFILFAVLVFGSALYDFVVMFWTLYGITSRRLIIFRPTLFGSVVESYYPPDITFVKKCRRKNGSGSIVFAAVREKSGKRTETVEIGFFGLSDVNSVEAMILDLRIPKRSVET